MESSYISLRYFNVIEDIKEQFDEDLEALDILKIEDGEWLVRADYLYQFLIKDNGKHTPLDIIRFINANSSMIDNHQLLDTYCRIYSSSITEYSHLDIELFLMKKSFKCKDQSIWKVYYDTYVNNLYHSKDFRFKDSSIDIIEELFLSSYEDDKLDTLIQLWNHFIEDELKEQRMWIREHDYKHFKCTNYIDSLICRDNPRMLKFLVDRLGTSIIIDYDFFIGIFTEKFDISDYLLSCFDHTPVMDGLRIPLYARIYDDESVSSYNYSIVLTIMNSTINSFIYLMKLYSMDKIIIDENYLVDRINDILTKYGGKDVVCPFCIAVFNYFPLLANCKFKHLSDKVQKYVDEMRSVNAELLSELEDADVRKS